MVSQEKFLLRFPCPGDTCSKSKILQWVHSGCSGKIYLVLNGDLFCGQCYTSDFIQNWRFHCSFSTHKGNYVPFSSIGDIRQAIVDVSKSLQNQGPDDFLAALEKIERNIMERWKRKNC